MRIFTALLTKNRSYLKGTKITPVGIVVHSTGANNPTLKRYVDCPEECGVNTYGNHLNRTAAEISMHGFIGYDKDGKVAVAHTLPYDIACWGCGSGSKGSYNYNPTAHIQFEMCEDNLNNKTYFNNVYKSAVEYCVFLCKKFNFDPLKKGVIVSHQEASKLGYASNHNDPSVWFKNFGTSMNNFRKDVKAGMIAKVGIDVSNYPILSSGDKDKSKGGNCGSYVSKVQQLLRDLGYRGSNLKKIEVDGVFGKNTVHAVKAFQKSQKIGQDGIVGTITWGRLING